jgi:hypothetical protein
VDSADSWSWEWPGPEGEVTLVEDRAP